MSVSLIFRKIKAPRYGSSTLPPILPQASGKERYSEGISFWKKGMGSAKSKLFMTGVSKYAAAGRGFAFNGRGHRGASISPPIMLKLIITLYLFHISFSIFSMDMFSLCIYCSFNGREHRGRMVYKGKVEGQPGRFVSNAPDL